MSVIAIRVSQEQLETLVKTKHLDLDKQSYPPNTFLVVKTSNKSDKTRLCRVDATGSRATLISDNLTAHGIKPRNKEQCMALDILLDDEVPVVIMSGKTGSGKTLLTLAAALQKVSDKKYKKIILTRPMSQVGHRELGILPGDVNERFLPYLGNFQSNLEHFGTHDLAYFMKVFNVECIPLQLIRGSSFSNAFICVDETQVMTHHEMLTLGTRIGEGSKLVILGDLSQRDEKIDRTNTGLHKIITSKKMSESELVGQIELLKVERSKICELFADVFE